MNNLRLVLALLVSLAALPVAAAPFCVNVTGIAPQCLYFDAVECGKRAYQLQGVCMPNPDELVLPPGSGRFCIVGQSRQSQCIYADRNSCAVAASAQGGVCVENAKARVQPNPYSSEPNKAY